MAEEREVPQDRFDELLQALALEHARQLDELRRRPPTTYASTCGEVGAIGDGDSIEGPPSARSATTPSDVPGEEQTRSGTFSEESSSRDSFNVAVGALNSGATNRAMRATTMSAGPPVTKALALASDVTHADTFGDGGSTVHTTSDISGRWATIGRLHSSKNSAAPSDATNGGVPPQCAPRAQKWAHRRDTAKRVTMHNNQVKAKAGLLLTAHPAWMDLPEYSDFHAPVVQSTVLLSLRGSPAAIMRRQRMASMSWAGAASELQKRVYMDPTSRRRLCWDVLGILMIVYDLIVLPLHAFPLDDSTLGRSMAFVVLSRVTTAYWGADILANFVSGYHDNADIEMDPFLIARNYVRGWFLLDALLVICDVVLSVVVDESVAVLRAGKSISRLLRIVRMVRLVKLRRIMADIMDRVPSEYARTLLHVMKLLAFIILLNHYIACGWFWLGMSLIGKKEKTWAQVAGVDDAEMWYQYTTSLHWSLTQFTPASMEVVPTNAPERTYTSCVIIFALVIFSSFVSAITGSVTALQQARERSLRNQMLLRRYLSERGVSTALVFRICHYAQVYHKMSGGMERKTAASTVEALQILPQSMRAEIRWEAFSPVLLVHPLFFQYNTASHTAVRHVCTQALSEVSSACGQEVFLSGQSTKVLKHMLFLLEGAMKHGFPSDPGYHHKLVEENIGKNEWAGEVAIWTDKAEIYGPFVAASCCDILLLDTCGFRSIARQFPRSFFCLAAYGERFLRHVTDACHGNPWRAVLCSSFDAVTDFAHMAFDTDILSATRPSSTDGSRAAGSQTSSSVSADGGEDEGRNASGSLLGVVPGETPEPNVDLQ